MSNVYEDLTEHYKAVARRIAAVAPVIEVKPVKVEPLKVEPVEVPLPVIRLGVPPVSDAARQYISSILMANKMGWKELVYPNRSTDMVRLRAQIYVFLNDRGWSLSQIGKLFNRDHSTVLYSIRNIRKWSPK